MDGYVLLPHMKAVSDRIILVPEKPKDNIGGVIIPDNLIGKPEKGIVFSVGIDCREVKQGDEILFLRGHGFAFTDEGEERLVITEKDVLGIFPSFTPENAIMAVTKNGENQIVIDKLPSENWRKIFSLIIADPNLK